MLASPVSDPVLMFSIVMILVLVAPLFAAKVKLPDIVGLILAGMIIGPYVIGLLERNDSIQLLGTIGILYIMFQAGLEINLEQIKQNKHYTLIFGLLTFTIPLFLGTVAGMYLLDMSFMASVLLASMFSSHTLLTFPLVSKLGLAKRRSVTTAIGGTIITDSLAFLILAIVIAANQGDLSLNFWLKLVSFILVYALIVILTLPRISSWFFKRFSSESGVEEYAFVLTALFVRAYGAHLAGLEPIIGAFLSGLLLNSYIPERSSLMNRIQFVGNSLFIPFFLISVGMLINPVAFITDSYALKVSFVMIIAGLVTKFLAAVLSGKILRMSSNEQGMIYGMSVNQAAATLAAVMIGYRIGIFNQAIVTGTIMMIIATSMVGSFTTQFFAKKLLLASKAGQDQESEDLVDRILVPISRAEHVKGLMDVAFLLHSSSSHEPIYPLHVVLEGGGEKQHIVEGENILTKAGILARTMQKDVLPLTKLDVNVASAVKKATAEHRVSKIILGWKDSGRYSLGSSISDQIINSTHEMIFVPRLVQPINITKRVLLIIPPMLYLQKGFIDSLKTIKKFISEISAKLLVVGEEDTCSEVKSIIGQAEAKYDFYYVQSWKLLPEDLVKTVKSDDMLMQMLARSGRIGWRLSFDRLAFSLGLRYPKNNLMAVYPFMHPEDFYQIPQHFGEDFALLKSIPESNFYLALKETQPEKVFEKMLPELLFRNQGKLQKELLSVLKEYPIELSPDIVLVHTHTSQIFSYQIYMAVSKTGFYIPKLKTTPRIMITLLSPKDMPIQKHLNMLSEISKIMMIEHFVRDLLEAKSYKHLLKRLDSQSSEQIEEEDQRG